LKKFLNAVLLLFLFLGAAAMQPLNTRAETVPYFTFSLNTESVSSGDLVKLRINANQTADTAAGFRMRVGYDDKILSFVRTETSGQIKSGTMATNSNANPILSVYVCNTNGTAAPELSGNIISFVFKVKEGVSDGKTNVEAHIDQICNYQAKQLNLNYDENMLLTVEQPVGKSDKAYLNELVPSQGKLSPEFSSDVYEYILRVDYDVRSVEFTADAGRKGTVKINRKSLGKAGSKTNIIATVTSEDKTNKAQYIITVSRASAPESSEADSRGGTETAKVQAKNQPAERTASGRGSPGGKTKRAAGSAAYAPESKTAPETSEIERAENGETIQAQPAYAGGGGRNIIVVGNQMPVFVLGVLVAVLCVLVGMSLTFWLKLNTKKQ
jgi:Cohesin domain.